MKLLIVALFILIVGCSKKEIPSCFKEFNVSSCTELFDIMQGTIDSPEKMEKMRNCYNKHCRR